MSTRRKLLLAALGIGVLYALYCLSLQFFAYTSDAFVANDVVLIAPEVEGRIVAVHVVDNQFVQAGDPLLTLDPTPYQLQVDLKTSQVAKARADADAARGRWHVPMPIASLPRHTLPSPGSANAATVIW